MRIVVTGGGSGGHITPILAVAHELKQAQPKAEIIYIALQGDTLADLPAQDPNIDKVIFIRAGKLRRYHSEGWKQFLDIPTMLKNLRDIFNTIAGVWQSIWLLRRLKPNVVFIKGGFVGVPVGLASALWRIPYVTHDSDALPGLANRIVAPWARKHAVALPKEVYAYAPEKTETVGVPVSRKYHPANTKEMVETRKRLGLEKANKVVLVTGGGLGAQRVNDAVADCVPDLLTRYPKLYVVHLAGRSKEQSLRQAYQKRVSEKDQARVIVKDFVSNLYDYSEAADVIITRAGGTSMAEFAAQAKACVVIPNPYLTGGHQLKNAQVLADRKTIKMVREDLMTTDHHALMPPLVELLDNPAVAKQLGDRLHTLAQPDAAHRLAMVLLEVANGA
jgi:UDP-N-acetylglucosamine--N-acetylmuramyl-(pentapeptide) pyrophosphoryl-undecaprenol N-acetylglucosamine transferase